MRGQCLCHVICVDQSEASFDQTEAARVTIGVTMMVKLKENI